MSPFVGALVVLFFVVVVWADDANALAAKDTAISHCVNVVPVINAAITLAANPTHFNLGLVRVNPHVISFHYSTYIR